MVTYYPHRVASGERFEPDNDAHQADDGLATRVLNQVRQSLCAIHGHDSMVQFQPDRMFLRCTSCGHESAGWAIDKPEPTVKAREEARRPGLSPRLVGVRRIA